MIKSIFGLLLFATQTWGQTSAPPIMMQKFGGLNDIDASVSLDPSQSQSCLNVESSLNGAALIKRPGYSRAASLTISTASATGAYSFVDPNGNKQQIVCQDHNCSKSTNNTAFSVFLSTAGGACMPTRWQFAQLSGLVYAVNDCHDVPWQYDGTTRTPLPTAPLGSIIEATKDRLVISGASADLSAVYYSQSGTPTNFTIGINSADPYVDHAVASGDQVRALKYAIGRFFIFKTNSIVSCILKDQYTSQCFPVSNTTGTSDPLSIIETPGSYAQNGALTSGSILFRGSDNGFWKLDQTGINPISLKISNLIASQTSGSNQSNTQTSQADWQAGSQTPLGSWNTTNVAGSVFPSSSTFIDNSGVAFGSGTLSGLTTTYINGSLQFPANVYQIKNGNFATGNLVGWTCATSASDGNIQNTCAFSSSGGNHANILVQSISGASAYQAYARIDILDVSSSVYSTQYNLGNTIPASFNINFAVNGISTRTLSIKYTVSVNDADGHNGITTIQSTTFTAISSMTITTVGTVAGKQVSWSIYANSVDEYFSIAQSSMGPVNFISRIYDTGFSTPIAGPFTVTVSSQAGTNADFQLHYSSSPNNDKWSAWVSTVNGALAVMPSRYWQYSSSFTTSVATASPRIDLVSLTAVTTGQFVTQCIQPGSNISTWGQLSCAQSLAGNGSDVFYATSAATCAALPTAAPTNSAGALQSGWTAQTNNGTISISTNAAIYIGWRSLLTSATDQAQIDACVVYWTNGNAAPPSWGTYDPVKNAAYWTSAINNSATGNRIFKYDLNLNEWYPFGLNASALYRDSNTNAIYFGDSTGGYWNKYGGVTSDNGAAINSFWKSKDFGNQTNPFLDNNYNKISLVTKNQVTGNMTVTYTTANNASGSYNVSLSTTSGIVYVHSNQNLPLMSPYQFVNIQFGNNSITPWEIDGMMLEYSSFPWKPQNP